MGVRSLCVVMFPPLFDGDLCFLEGVKDFSVQQLAAEACVNTFSVAVIPKRTWLYVSSFCAHDRDPVANVLRDELRAIV